MEQVDHHDDDARFDASASDPKKRGRKPAKFWVSFTTLEEPYKLRSAPCRHCQAPVNYHKKWEQAKSHLMRCDPFLKVMQSTAVANRPDWFIVELEKRRRSSSRLLPLELLRGDDGCVNENVMPSPKRANTSALSSKPRAKKRDGSSAQEAPSMLELLVLQALRAGKADRETYQFALLQTHPLYRESQLKNSMTTIYHRVASAIGSICEKAVASGSSTVLKAVIGDDSNRPQSSIEYWVLVDGHTFFIQQSSMNENSSRNADEIVQAIERVQNLLSFPCSTCVVDASAPVVEQLQPRTTGNPRLEIRMSPHRAIVEVIKELLVLSMNTDNADLALNGVAAFGALCGDVFQLMEPESRVVNAAYGTLEDVLVVVDSSRTCSAAQIVRGILAADSLPQTFPAVLHHLSLIASTAIVDEMRGQVESADFATKARVYQSIFKPLTVALAAYASKPVCRHSDVFLTYAMLQETYQNAAELDDEMRMTVLRVIHKYKAVFQYRESLLAHLIDPAHFGEYLEESSKRQTEQNLLSLRAGQEDEKQALFVEYTEYQVAAVHQRDDPDGFLYRMLKERKKTVLQYWLTDGRRWPKLQAVALSIERVPSDAVTRSSESTGFSELAAGSLGDPEILYMQKNAPLLSVQEVFTPRSSEAKHSPILAPGSGVLPDGLALV